MNSPYAIEGPAVISFSGGRTSAYMLWHILDYYGGKLPDDVHVIFANTGKEVPETLHFIQQCSESWSVHVTWLEYDPDAEYQTRVVSHNSASRNGEPFERMIDRYGQLPNLHHRICTAHLKTKRFARYGKHHLGWSHWQNVIGIRADESRRILGKENPKEYPWNSVAPLVYADVTSRDVVDFWRRQPFDLRLESVNGATPEGNCDLCFLKGAKLLQGIMRKDPSKAAWWIAQEQKKYATTKTGKPIKAENNFFHDPGTRPPYIQLLNIVERQGDLFDDGVGSIDCMCTD